MLTHPNDLRKAANAKHPSYQRIPRLYNWDQRYTNYIQSCREKSLRGVLRFGWDTEDPEVENCCTFVGGAVEAQIGVNVYSKMMEGKSYKTALGASRCLLTCGFPSLDAAFSTLFVPKPTIMLARGDIGLIESNVTLPGESIAERTATQYGVVMIDPPYYWVMTHAGLQRSLQVEVLKGYHVGL